jgi:hypothetical protein
VPRTVRQAFSNLVNLAYLNRETFWHFCSGAESRQSQEEHQRHFGAGHPLGCSSELRAAPRTRPRQQTFHCSVQHDDLFSRRNICDRLIKEHVTGVIYVPIADTEEKNRTIIERFGSMNPGGAGGSHSS